MNFQLMNPTTSSSMHAPSPAGGNNRKRRSSEILFTSGDSSDRKIMLHASSQQSSACNAQLSSSITLPVGGGTQHAFAASVIDNDVRLVKSDHPVNYLIQQQQQHERTLSLSSSSTVSTGAGGTAAAAPPPPTAIRTTKRTMHCKKAISSPHDFFAAMLRARGYPATMLCSLKCGYHNSPTKHQTASYGVALTKAIRSSDSVTARSLLAAGLHPNACNKFGESIVHAACRRGDCTMLRALVDAGASVRVADDFGRTPLHDACWTSSPCFDAVRCLLDEDPWLLCAMDCRGSAPLGYARKAHWGVWIGFLGAIADRYWPDLTDGQGGMRADGDAEAIDANGGDGGGGECRPARIPPLALVEPNSRPLPDPTFPNRTVLDLEVIELLANGKLAPGDLDDDGVPIKTKLDADDSGPVNNSSLTSSRITLDPLRSSGSNATTMVMKLQQAQSSALLRPSKSHATIVSKDSQGGVAATLLGGYVQVEATTVLDCT